MVVSDVSRLFVAQGARAFAYGLGAVLLGTVLEARGWSSGRAALFFAAALTGTVAANLIVGARADRWGRRRTYSVLCALLALAGVVLVGTGAGWPIVVVALTGVLSTDVIESGPFTTLEQSMIGTRAAGQELVGGLGRYNAIAAAAGACGALVVGVPGWARDSFGWGPTDEQMFLVLTVAGVVAFVISRRLSPEVEAVRWTPPARRVRADRNGADRFVGSPRCSPSTASEAGSSPTATSPSTSPIGSTLSPATIGVTFAVLGVLSTVSFLIAPLLAARIGLLETMVVTHIPSSVFLAAVVVAPTLPVALACLAGRALLSQMDVPTRQAYVVALAGADDRSRAIATTNTARYVTRPAGAVAGGAVASVAAGAPLVLAAVIKVSYDVAVWRSFRGVPLADPGQERAGV